MALCIDPLVDVDPRPCPNTRTDTSLKAESIRTSASGLAAVLAKQAFIGFAVSCLDQIINDTEDAYDCELSHPACKFLYEGYEDAHVIVPMVATVIVKLNVWHVMMVQLHTSLSDVCTRLILAARRSC